MSNDVLSGTLDRVEKAIAAMGAGDPQAYKECWAKSPDATLFGAWGPIEKGHERAAASRTIPILQLLTSRR